jgi:Ca2+-binding EF-hand superfamily protein
MADDKLRKAFEQFDEDKDGHIDSVELKKALERSGLQPSIQVVPRYNTYT